MKKFYIATLLGGVAIMAVGYALAQGIVPLSSPTGTERITVQPIQPNGQPGVIPAEIALNQIRNATGYQLLSTATSGTFNVTNAVNSFLIAVQPNGTTTINTPASPFDGELFQVCNVSNATLTGQTVTLAATAGSTLATGVVTALGGLTPRNCEELQFTLSNTTWYQLR